MVPLGARENFETQEGNKGDINYYILHLFCVKHLKIKY